MKTKKTFILFILYAILFATGIFAVKIAASVMREYKFMADGILGLVVIYLSYLYNFSSAKEKVENNDLNVKLYEYPEYIKDFFSTFFWGLILYWAVKEIIYMVVFLVTY